MTRFDELDYVPSESEITYANGWQAARHQLGLPEVELHWDCDVTDHIPTKWLLRKLFNKIFSYGG